MRCKSATAMWRYLGGLSSRESTNGLLQHYPFWSLVVLALQASFVCFYVGIQEHASGMISLLDCVKRNESWLTVGKWAFSVLFFFLSITSFTANYSFYHSTGLSFFSCTPSIAFSLTVSSTLRDEIQFLVYLVTSFCYSVALRSRPCIPGWLPWPHDTSASILFYFQSTGIN